LLGCTDSFEIIGLWKKDRLRVREKKIHLSFVLGQNLGVLEKRTPLGWKKVC